MQQSAARPPRLLTLILLSGLAVVSLNMFLPSLSNIAVAFQTDYALVNLSIAGYAAMTAVLQLIMGPLSDRFGRRPVILSALVLFCLASLGCLLADDIETFLFFRMMQAAIISGQTISMAVIRDSAPAEKAASLMGYISMAWAIAPMIGPAVGGVLDELFGWRANFLAFLCLGSAILVLSWFDLRETNTNRAETLKTQFQSYPELFRSRRFWGYALCMTFSRGSFYAFISGTPLVAIAVFEISATKLGIYIGSITAGFVMGSFLAGRFAEGRALTTMMIAGCVLGCSGLIVGLICLAAGFVHEVTFFGACVCVGIGNGMAMPASNSGAMSVRPKLAGSAAGLAGAMQVAGGALISGLTGAVLAPASASFGMLGIMLLSSTLGLAAAIYVLWVDRRSAADVAPQA